MAGLFALLFGLACVGSSFAESVQNDVYTNSSRNLAKTNGSEMYRDSNMNWRWTANDEIVNVVGKPGSSQGYKVVGTKTRTVYHNELSDAEILADRYKRGLEYCKENGIKYFPWDFKNDLHGWVDVTGIEVDTGKKYAIRHKGDLFEREKDYYLVYLEDEPHWANRGYGDYKSYDAVHDGTKEMYDNDFWSVSHEKHEYSLHWSLGKCPGEQDYQYWYYSKCYPVSEEEFKERSSVIKGFESRVERQVPSKGY